MKEITLNPSGVLFDEEQHRYTLGGVELTGITSTLLRTAFPDKYKGVDEEVLNHAAARGHAVHLALQNHFTGCFVPPVMEKVAEAAERLMKEKALTPIEWEYIVTDREEFASPIDIVCVNADGQIVIVDTKTTSQLDYDYVAYQTAIYDYLFRLQNPSLTVAGHYCLWLSVNDSYEFRHEPALEILPIIGDDILDVLLVAYHNDLPFNPQAYADFPRKVRDVSSTVVQLVRQQEETEARLDELKQGLYDLMEKYHIKRFSNSVLSLSAVQPSVTTKLDGKRLTKELPKVAAKYMTSTTRKGYLKIKLMDK